MGGASAGCVMPGINPFSTTWPHFGQVASGLTVEGVRNLLQCAHQGTEASHRLGESRPGVVLIFTQKADENLATLVKAVDEVQKNNAKLGTVVVGVSGVQAADFEKLQTTHKLTTPLTVAEDKDGPEKYKLNKDAAVTVLVYKQGGGSDKTFGFKDTKEAADKAKDIAKAAGEVAK